MREICSRPIAAAAVAAIPMTVRSSLMPRTSCGAPVHGGHGWGWIFTAVEHWNAAAGMSASAATASPPCSRSPPGGPGRRGSGVGLADGYPASRPTPFQTNGVAERFNRMKEQIIHGRIYRNMVDAVREQPGSRSQKLILPRTKMQFTVSRSGLFVSYLRRELANRVKTLQRVIGGMSNSLSTVSTR